MKLTLLGGLLLVIAMAKFADRLVYFPTRQHDGGTPRALGLAYEDAAPVASDGVRLHGWYVPAADGAPVLLFLHGNAGNISHRLEKLAVFNELGAGALLLDYRGYGHSEGAPDEPGTYRDADAAYEWLLGRGIAPQRIVAYGESLGGPIATELASRRPLGGLILESAPSSILGVAQHHYAWLPVSMFLSVRYDAAARIGRVRSPLLILHSPDDEIVPFSMAETLYGAANQPKQLIKLRGGHNDNFLIAADTYRAALEGFLRALPRANPTPPATTSGPESAS